MIGLASFAQGFAGGRQIRLDREDKAAEDARKDAMIAAIGRQPMGATPGPAGPGQGEAGAAPSGGGAGGTDLLGLIDKTEGGGAWNTLYGHSQNGGAFDGVDVSNMTLAELEQFSDPSGPYGQWVKGQVGRVATPMGRFQIVGTTMRNAAEGMGLSPDTKFTPETQTAMAGYLARNRLAGAKDPVSKRTALRSEWEGFRNVPDALLDQAIADFEAKGGVLGSAVRPMGVGTQ